MEIVGPVHQWWSCVPSSGHHGARARYL